MEHASCSVCYAWLCVGLVVIHIAMPDFTPPTIAQIDQFVQLVDDARAKHEVNSPLGHVMLTCC